MTLASSFRRAVVALVAAAAIGACAADAHVPVGYTLEPAPVVADVTLPDAAAGGAPMALRAEPGGVLLTFFGYTTCPDVCPLTMSELRRARAALGDRAARVDVAMVTVDPDRDSDEVLTNYVRTFLPDARALRTTDPAELRVAADAFGADYVVTQEPDGSVAVSHTGSVFAVDSAGVVRLVWMFGTSSADIAADLTWLLDQLDP